MLWSVRLTLERGRVENHETPSFTIDKMVAASRPYKAQPSVQPALTVRNSISRPLSAAFEKDWERARGTSKP